MYISKAKKYRDQGDGTAIAYDYYRLTKSYIDKDGKTKHRSVLCLGELPGFDKDERNRLAAMLTTMIEDGQSVMCVMKKITWYIFIICYNIKSLMVVPFMNLLKSTISPIPCKCPVSEYCQILHFPLPSIEGCREL